MTKSERNELQSKINVSKKNITKKNHGKNLEIRYSMMLLSRKMVL